MASMQLYFEYRNTVTVLYIMNTASLVARAMLSYAGPNNFTSISLCKEAQYNISVLQILL